MKKIITYLNSSFKSCQFLFADREDKIYMREELNRIRDSYDEIAKEADEKSKKIEETISNFKNMNKEILDIYKNIIDSGKEINRFWHIGRIEGISARCYEKILKCAYKNIK